MIMMIRIFVIIIMVVMIAIASTVVLVMGDPDPSPNWAWRTRLPGRTDSVAAVHKGTVWRQQAHLDPALRPTEGIRHRQRHMQRHTKFLRTPNRSTRQGLLSLVTFNDTPNYLSHLKAQLNNEFTTHYSFTNSMIKAIIV